MLKPRAVLASITLALAYGVSAHGQSAPEATPLQQARVIVKFKTGATSLQPRALSATRSTAQAAALGRRAGLALRGGAVIADRTHVVTASGMDSNALARKLAEDSDVEYAEPDGWRRPHAVPTDPRYASGLGGTGPAAGQWYLRPPVGALRASIDAESAWDVTLGNSTVVVAVLDTGVRYDHPELLPVGSGGNLLPGYDMVSDPTTANDGDGRDADASDPGDWVSATEAAPGGAFDTCEGGETPSTWHGTQTAGLIGAATNNGLGMASVGRTVRVLPVRVLGKCGGRDSDIITGMRWAAGLPLAPLLPTNPNPAKVINLSLGGEGVCSQAYADAIREVTAAGALVVVSAGNLGVAVSAPANCLGVMAVGGLQHNGAKVSFSDLGPEVAISAPGGDCVNNSGECIYPILTTTNTGAQSPVGAGYTDAFDTSVGTSFSAPLVSGTAALMLSANPALTPQQLKLLLQSTARPFPTSATIGGGLAQCTSPQYDSAGAAVRQLECACTTGTCGAGMLDTGAAVRAANAGGPIKVHARIDVLPTQPSAGAKVVLSAANTGVDAGRSVTSYQWALLDGGGIVSSIAGDTSRDAFVIPSAEGQFSVRLTVTDSAATTSSTDLTVSVGVARPEPPPAPSGGGGGALGAGWSIALLMGAVVLGWGRRRRGFQG